jgi:ribosomal protein L37AE/L43A
MVLIPKCDKCGDVYSGGFNSKRQTVISGGPKMKKKDFTVVIKINPPHLCSKCFKVVMRTAIK